MVACSGSASAPLLAAAPATSHAMHTNELILAPTLASMDSPPRAALDRVRDLGFRAVQIGAGRPGLRPRELDRSARRDLLATLARRELILAGIDLWVPPGDLLDPARSPRAMDALLAAIDLAADLDRRPLSVALPGELEPEMTGTLLAAASLRGVDLVDHRVGADPGPDPVIRAGVDPAACLAGGVDPADEVIRLGQRLGSARLVDLLTGGTRAPIGADHGGRLDVQSYRVALSAVGYRRPVVIDARQWADVEVGLVRTKEVWEGIGPGG